MTEFGRIGIPDFRYVATHICDSVKRRLKSQGTGAGIQGEFGIGLLSFWTVGERLVMTSTGSDQRAYQMTMNKGDPSYEISPRRVQLAERGRYSADSSFDAAVGRCILQFVPDLVPALRSVAKQVRPDGIVAFQEVSWAPCISLSAHHRRRDST